MDLPDVSRLSRIVGRYSAIGCLAMALFGGKLMAAVPGDPDGIKSRLDAIKTTKGAGPNVDEFRRVMAQGSVTWSLRELGKLWSEFGKLQDPVVDRAQVLELLRAKYASLGSIRCRYRSSILAGAVLPHEYAYFEGELVQSDRSFLLRGRQGPDPSDLGVPTVTSYDGSLFRIYEEDNSRVGIIENYTKIGKFINENYPLGAWKLVDSGRIFGEKKEEIDIICELSRYPYVVQEELETLDGVGGLVRISDLGSDCWFDPNRGFALVRFRTGPYGYDVNSGVYSSDKIEGCDVRYSGFIAAGSGILLPSVTEAVWTWEDRSVRKTRLVLDEVKLNPVVGEGTFVNIFPRGTTINDRVRNVVYLVGSHPTIAGALDREALAHRTSIPRSLIVANILALAAVIVYLVSRRANRRGEDQ